jgi:hypothetical protein
MMSTDQIPEHHDGKPLLGLGLSEGLEPARYVCGQELYWEPSRYSSNRKDHGMVTITKVGRKWLELSNGCRVDAATLIADAGKYSSPGQCYRDRAAREEVVEAEAAWSSLRHRMGYTVPKGVNAQDIAHATRLLGL